MWSDKRLTCKLPKITILNKTKLKKIMKAQEILGTVDKNGQLFLDEPIKVNTSSRVKVIVLFPEADVDEDDEPKELVLESLQTSLQEVSEGKTKTVSELWDGIDAD